MQQEFIKMIIGQGVYCTLFVGLLYYVLKENSKREGNYQEVINKLTEKFSVVDDIKDDVQEIKTKIK